LRWLLVSHDGDVLVSAAVSTVIFSILFHGPGAHPWAAGYGERSRRADVGAGFKDRSVSENTSKALKNLRKWCLTEQTRQRKILTSMDKNIYGHPGLGDRGFAGPDFSMTQNLLLFD
jgi:hypothetical protein